MRIALDARLTYYTQGGISQYIRQLTRHLPAIDPENEYLILHSRKDRETLAMPPNAHRVDCWTPAHHMLERTTLTMELVSRRPHLLHSLDFIPPRGGPWNSIITIHDLTFMHYPDFLTREAQRYYNGQIRAAVQRADAILADSEATRQDILDLLHVQPASVTTVHLAPHPRFQKQPSSKVAALRRRLRLPTEYLLFVGTFEPRKNVAGLLHAYAAMRTDLPDAPCLVLAGSPGWLFDDTKLLVEELGLHQFVSFLPNLPSRDLPTLYTGAILLILPSHYEGFGFPVLEAMACGTPAVIANRASLPEIAGGAALQCNPNDPDSISHAMQLLLGNSSKRAELREKGFARVREFSWASCCDKTLAVYQSVLDKH